VICNDALALEVALEVAVTVTVVVCGTLAGALYVTEVVVTLVNDPVPDGDKDQVTPEFVESFATAAVILTLPPPLMVWAVLGDSETVTGRPCGVLLPPPQAARKIKLPTIKRIEKLRTAASSDIDQLANVARAYTLRQEPWVVSFAGKRPHVACALHN